MKPIAPKDLIQSEKPWRVDLLRVTFVSLVLGGIGHSQAESVYRCGNSYSSSTECANEHATEINANSAHIEPRHQASTPNAAATSEQREADALEKKRVQSERQATQNQPVRVVVAPPESPTAATPQTPRYGQRHQRPQSPYFTAKDPNKPVKKAAKD